MCAGRQPRVMLLCGQAASSAPGSCSDFKRGQRSEPFGQSCKPGLLLFIRTLRLSPTSVEITLGARMYFTPKGPDASPSPRGCGLDTPIHHVEADVPIGTSGCRDRDVSYPSADHCAGSLSVMLPGLRTRGRHAQIYAVLDVHSWVRELASGSRRPRGSRLDARKHHKSPGNSWPGALEVPDDRRRRPGAGGIGGSVAPLARQRRAD
jgi:hypothetical protein